MKRAIYHQDPPLEDVELLVIADHGEDGVDLGEEKGKVIVSGVKQGDGKTAGTFSPIVEPSKSDDKPNKAKS